MTIWRMCIVCWIPKATDTHSECVILIAFQLQQWLNEWASMLRYTYIDWLSCSLISDSLPVTLLLHRFLTTSTRVEIWGIYAIFLAVKVILRNFVI